MSSFAQYLLRIIATSILAGITSSLVEKNSTVGKTVKTICSLVMTFVLLSPLVKVDLEDIIHSINIKLYTADTIVDEGKRVYNDRLTELIIEQTQSYILDAATSYGADIVATVYLEEGDFPVPNRVKLEGVITPYTKERLSRWITENLNITRENQIWK